MVLIEFGVAQKVSFVMVVVMLSLSCHLTSLGSIALRAGPLVGAKGVRHSGIIKKMNLRGNYGKPRNTL